MSKNKTDISTRMKDYENASVSYLTKKIPVIIRIDGKAFHTFTKGFKKPFDPILSSAMQETMKYLCENIHGCVLGYTQSDEITLVLCDYQKVTSDSWFDYKVQKICSVAASMATLAFNKCFKEKVEIAWKNAVDSLNYFDSSPYVNAYDAAMFDARAFNVPKEEVCNNLIWRQLDATRNSIQMVGQANFSHKELQYKNCKEIQEMLFTQNGINWSNMPTKFKRGSCCVKQPREFTNEKGEKFTRMKWVIDNEVPIFSKNRDYIDNRIIFN